MNAYMTVEEFQRHTIMPLSDVEALQLMRPGFLEEVLGDVSAEIDAQLKKRYAVPFTAPVPRIVLRWVTRIVTLEAYLARGSNLSSAQDEIIKEAAGKAESQIQLAADAETGLYDLPLRQDLPGSSGISQGGPFSYAEADPYAWTDVQAEAFR